MRLHLADIHLTRVRLFGRQKEERGIKNYPWESPPAEKLIHACGCHRRDEELADAKQAILS